MSKSHPGARIKLLSGLWGVCALFGLASFLSLFPRGFAQLRTIGEPTEVLSDSRAFFTLQLAPEEVALLESIGGSLDAYAIYQSVIGTFVVLWYVTLSLVIFRRRSGDWLALWVSMTLLTMGTIFLAPFKPTEPPLWQFVILALLHTMFVVSFLLLGFLLPDGRFAPPWTRALVVPFIILALVPTIGVEGSALQVAVVLALRAVQITPPALAQFYRLRTCKLPVRRQQTKWVAIGYSAAAVGLFGQQVGYLTLQPGAARLAFFLVGIPITSGFLLLFPLLLGFAILRYRLWDIELFVNRAVGFTILSGSLTGSFLLVYFTVVLLLGQFLGALPQLVNAFALGAGTLVLLWAFQPLRYRVLSTLSRRLFAGRYDLQLSAAPDGTVTILFSDIENSTVLVERLGDERWISILRAHNEIIRRQIRAYKGHEVNTWGDAFMVAYDNPRQALLSAIAIQRALVTYNQEHATEPIRVRIGLHKGETVREAGDFYGRTVIMASRIAAQAVGGEIVVSSTVKEANDGIQDVRFDQGRDLHLKGLSGPHRVYGAIGKKPSM